MYCIFYMWRINFNNCILLVLRGRIQFPHVTWSFALLSPYHVVWGKSVVPQLQGMPLLVVIFQMLHAQKHMRRLCFSGEDNKK